MTPPASNRRRGFFARPQTPLRHRSHLGYTAGVSDRIRALVALVLVPIACASGCGTIINIQQEFGTPSTPPEFYGGVRIDTDLLVTRGEFFDMLQLIRPLAVIDLPLSAVFDTLALPWVAVRQVLAARSPTQPELDEFGP